MLDQSAFAYWALLSPSMSYITTYWAAFAAKNVSIDDVRFM